MNFGRLPRNMASGNAFISNYASWKAEPKIGIDYVEVDRK